MFDHFSVRKPLLCMAGILAYAITSAGSARAESRTVPVLSGTYIFNATQNCLPVTNDLQNITGTMTFDPKTGKMNLLEYITSGNPLTLEKGKGTQSYSNSANTFTLGTTTFPAFYGKRAKGIATSFSFIGLIEGGCALQASLSLQ
ncbi:MAG TPA: hypothetical protein VHU18_12885 [Rhizomicrobium sp.]|nr:hypothetical protein [Rhizomicrobium sp.]